MKAAVQKKQLETRKQLMERLQISESTLYRWMQKKTIPFIRIGGRGIRFDVDAVDRVIEKMGGVK